MWTGRTACISSACARRSASIGVIYESRPNVTADAGALCLKAGNAVILRGGSDSHRSSPRHPCLPGRRAERAGLAGGRDPAGADHATAPPSARCCKGSTAASTSSCRAAARAWSRACRTKRACRSSRISKASAISISTARRARHGGADRRQRQDAAHRRLRRRRDAAGRPRRGRRRICRRSSTRCSRRAAKSAATTKCAAPMPA